MSNTLPTVSSTRNVIEVVQTGDGFDLHITPNQAKLAGWLLGQGLAAGAFNTQDLLDALFANNLIATAVDLSVEDVGARGWGIVLNETIRPVLECGTDEQRAQLNEAQLGFGYGLGAFGNGDTYEALVEEIGFNADDVCELADEDPSTGDPEADAAMRELAQLLGIKLH